MSEIFDALQRSESGSPAKDTLSTQHVLEVLRRVEDMAQSDREQGTAAALLHPEEPAELDNLLRQPSFAEGAAPAPSAAPLSNRARAIQFNQCATETVSVGADSHLVCAADPDSPAAEAFRLLSVRLRDLRESRSLKRVLITSTVPREGKSMVVGNLACTLARSSRTKTLVLEGDIRRPTQRTNLGLKNGPGLCEWLQGHSALNESVYRLEPLGFWIMPAGECPMNPLELLHPGRMASLMSQLSEWFDLILIDSPPVLPLADTSLWMKLADGILLVTRRGVTEKQSLQRGLDAIDSNKLLGGILNSSNSLLHTDYYYRSHAPAEAGLQ